MQKKRIRIKMKNKPGRNKLKELTAGGGLIFRDGPGKKEPEVLLIFRRGVWDLPKGKQEQNETIEECAVREVAEETGVSKLPRIISPLIQTYHEYERGDVRYGKTTYWYAMRLPFEEASFAPEEKEGIKKVEWHALQTAKDRVGFDNLRDVLKELAQTRE